MRIENHSEIEHNSRSVTSIQVECKQYPTDTRALEHNDQSIQLYMSMDLKKSEKQ